MKIDSRRKFKDTFNRLFKKYHPDNKESGDAELFIQYKTAYDEAIKRGILNQLPEDIINITTEQAFFGTTLDYKGVKIIIPSKFFKRKRCISFNDKDGQNHLIKIDIKPMENERINFDEYGDLDFIERKIDITLFDAILGFKKCLEIFGKEIIIEYEPYEVLKYPTKWFSQCGFWKLINPNERHGLQIRCVITKIDLDKEDKHLLEKMREKYAERK